MIAAVIANESASSCHMTVWKRSSKLASCKTIATAACTRTKAPRYKKAGSDQQPRHELAAEEDDRNREQQAEHEQADIPVRRAGHRQDVVETRRRRQG